MKKFVIAALAASLSLGVSFAALAADKVGVVVKIGGIPWFNAMDAGIKEQGAKLGLDAFMVGPTSADPALQVRAIEDLIAQGVKVIGVVPNDAKVLEPVLAKATEAGIFVITHESPSQKGADWNFELASRQVSVRLMQSFSPRKRAARANMPCLSARLQFRFTMPGPMQRSPISRPTIPT